MKNSITSSSCDVRAVRLCKSETGGGHPCGGLFDSLEAADGAGQSTGGLFFSVFIDLLFDGGDNLSPHCFHSYDRPIVFPAVFCLGLGPAFAMDAFVGRVFAFVRHLSVRNRRTKTPKLDLKCFE